MNNAPRNRMILALGDFEAGRIEPETIKQALIDHAAPSQPQYDRLTNLFRSGHLAYNGSDIPELTQKGQKLYAALDRGRDPAERPAVIASASLPPLERKDGRPVFFANAQPKQRETEAAEKAPGDQQSEAAAALLREAEIAVTQMQEKGIGFNETALSRAVFEAHKAGLASAEPERALPAQPEREMPDAKPRRFSAFSDAERERVRDRAAPSVIDFPTGKTDQALENAARDTASPMRQFADPGHKAKMFPPEREAENAAPPKSLEQPTWHDQVFRLAVHNERGGRAPDAVYAVPAAVAREHFAEPADALAAHEAQNEIWEKYLDAVAARESAISGPVMLDSAVDFDRDHADRLASHAYEIDRQAAGTSATADRNAEAERSAEEPRRFSAFSDMKRDSGRDQGDAAGRTQRFDRNHDGGRES